MLTETKAYPSRVLFLIAGVWRGDKDREMRPIINPATEAELGSYPVASDQDIDDALEAADKSFQSWSQTGTWVRAEILHRAADLVSERRTYLAQILTLENGKPLTDSQLELDRVIEAIRYCAEEAKRAYGRVLPMRSRLLVQSSIKRPIGPIAAFVPWNFPAFLAARKIAAALAAGCTVILKPPEETPAVCAELCRAFSDAGTPAGALNILYGVPSHISSRLIASPIIRKISFTGSVPVGRLLASQAAQNLKPSTMELGGHAPVVIFDDVNVEAAARACVAFKFRNSGQVCLSPSRFFVHESILEDFIKTFVSSSASIKVGHGLNDGVQMGPLNNARRMRAAQDFVEDARSRGSQVLLGGQRLGDRGFFFPPTVLTGLHKEAKILHEEPFCPIAPILPFSSMEEAIRLANSLNYGLAAYAFTNRMERSAEFSERVEAGWIGINSFTPSLSEAPIGGMKDSGLGYEGGPEGLDAYLHSKFISQSNTTV